MCYFTPPGSPSCCFLDPLESLPVPQPFPEAHPCLSGLGISFNGLFNQTPSSVDDALPTPGPPPLGTALIDLHGNVHAQPPAVRPALPVLTDALVPPPAPHLADLDSFSEGTALGSFNFSLTSDCDENAPVPSVAFSPSHPTRSIEIWIADVRRCSAADSADESEEPAAKRRRVSEVADLNVEEPRSASAVIRPLPFAPISPGPSAQDDIAEESLALVRAKDARPTSAPPGLG